MTPPTNSPTSATRSTSSRRHRRRWWIAPLVLAGGFAVLEIAAALRVSSLRAQRSTLAGLLYVKELGTGDPMIFLAGLAGTTTYWGNALDRLAGEHRLLLLDTLGFGNSPWPDLEYTLEEHLDALRQTLIARGATDRVTLVGHSFGAILAAHYAARFPADIERVVLLGTPIFRSPAEGRARIRAMSSTAGLFSLNRTVARASCKFHEAFGPLLMRLLPRIDHHLPPAVLAEGMLHTWQAFDGSLRHVVLASPIEIPLRQIGSLVTLVHGRHDPITALERVREVADDVGATVVVTDDNHGSYASREPDSLLRVVGPRPTDRGWS